MSFEDFNIFNSIFWKERDFSSVVKNATHTNTKSSGTWGQSYALVFDGPPQHSKGKSALARVFFIEILSLLIALPLAEPLVKSSSVREELPCLPPCSFASSQLVQEAAAGSACCLDWGPVCVHQKDSKTEL